jgi:hypothetical protein
MRRTRRGGGSALEFGGTGEDSFVAVVVTKLTGALLFILLLTMVIMALLPKAVDLEQTGQSAAQSTPASGRTALQITTPASLPDAVAGRPYVVALAATGGSGAPRWRLDGNRPDWLALDESSGRIAGTPPAPTKEPLTLRISAHDGDDAASREIQLAVLPATAPATAGSWWRHSWSAVHWRAWLEQGVGFLMLWLVHLLGINLLAGLERQALHELATAGGPAASGIQVQRRFASYRVLLRITTLAATAALGVWLVASRGA